MSWPACISCQRHLPPRYFGRGVLQCTTCRRHWEWIARLERERVACVFDDMDRETAGVFDDIAVVDRCRELRRED